MAQLNISQGGLMRCCIQTLAEYSGLEKEGTTLSCKYCENVMVVKENFWQWDRS